MHSIVLRILPLLLIIPSVCHSQQPQYLAREFEHEGYTLQYREATFTSDKDTTQSIIVILHARHGNGYYNDAHQKADGVKETERYLTESGRNAVLIIPQIAHPREWNEAKPIDGQYMSDIVRDLIISYADSMPSAEIYLMGTSMDGSEVWRLVNDNPQMFTAALEAASNPRNAKLQNLVHTPIIAVTGSRDRMVKPGKIAKIVDAINHYGGETKMVLLDGYAHGETCRNAFTVANLSWLLSHRKH